MMTHFDPLYDERIMKKKASNIRKQGRPRKHGRARSGVRERSSKAIAARKAEKEASNE